MSGWALSPAAFDDLDAILDYVDHESGAPAADRLLADFQAAFLRLAENPRIGTPREDLAGAAVRCWGVHSYLVLYKSEAAPIRILRVVHGARELGRLLGD